MNQLLMTYILKFGNKTAVQKSNLHKDGDSIKACNNKFTSLRFISRSFEARETPACKNCKGEVKRIRWACWDSQWNCSEKQIDTDVTSMKIMIKWWQNICVEVYNKQTHGKQFTSLQIEKAIAKQYADCLATRSIIKTSVKNKNN